MSSSTTSNSVEHSAPKKAERSSFSITCSLLSQYLKEKGSFGDLSLGMASGFQPTTLPGTSLPESRKTMNLFPGAEPPTDCDRTRDPGPSTGNSPRSMDLFPQQPSSAQSDAIKSTAAVPTSGKPEAPQMTIIYKGQVIKPEADQMTIFYGGQVVVFDDFPAEKAQEIMLLLSQGSSQCHPGFPPNDMVPAKPHDIVGKAPVESTTTGPVASSLNPTPVQAQPNATPTISDLPLARRASLHRFLEKRKDRITSKAPYQMNSPLQAPSKPDADTKPWLGLAAPR